MPIINTSEIFSMLFSPLTTGFLHYNDVKKKKILPAATWEFKACIFSYTCCDCLQVCFCHFEVTTFQHCENFCQPRFTLQIFCGLIICSCINILAVCILGDLPLQHRQYNECLCQSQAKVTSCHRSTHKGKTLRHLPSSRYS